MYITFALQAKCRVYEIYDMEAVEDMELELRHTLYDKHGIVADIKISDLEYREDDEQDG